MPVCNTRGMSCTRLLTAAALLCVLCAADYLVDNTAGMGRVFDGIGGLSGGGATSKLLVSYPETLRNQILDYLFKPDFGASLQILKVEIGGDAQSTEGTEASHMHAEWDEDYSRGYEWWLMVEAKKRNPHIKLYGLPWAFPGWLGAGSGSPYKYPNKTAKYVTKWVLGAKKHYNLTIDYLGIWNERKYNVEYIIALRQTLDANGLKNVRIIAADGGWDISKDVLKNKTLHSALYGIGAHYPGTRSTTEVKSTGLPLWSSEDYSTFNDNKGAGCWARILNQNYVNGDMSSTISWNLIASYYSKLPFDRCGLMTAKEPWSGHYDVSAPIWITAHTTQFTDIGWTYFKQKSGSGKLISGGSFVSLLSPDKKQFTMVIETMSHNHSMCIRPALPAYTVTPQKATFVLKGATAGIKTLQVWFSKLSFPASNSTILMKRLEDIVVSAGAVTLSLDVDTVYTLSTVASAKKGNYTPPPPSKSLTLPYKDNFEKYPANSEALYFVPQIGSFEIRNSSTKSHGMVNRQTVLDTPIYWCAQSALPITLGGNYYWKDIVVSIDMYIPALNGTEGVFVAARVDQGGCQTDQSRGIYAWFFPGNSSYVISRDLKHRKLVKQGHAQVKKGSWFNVRLSIRETTATLAFDSRKVQVDDIPADGFVGYGTYGYGYADFDNFSVKEYSAAILP